MMTRTQHHLFIPALAVLAVLALAGCASDPTGQQAPLADPMSAAPLQTAVAVMPSGAERRVTRQGQQGIPARIAAAPAVFTGGLSTKESARADQLAYTDMMTRQVINAMGSTAYRLTPPAVVVDWMELQGLDPRQPLPEERIGDLTDALGVDGLLLLEVVNIDEVNLVFTGEINAELRLRLMDPAGRELARVEHDKAFGNVKVPFSIFSAMMAVVSTQTMFNDRNRLVNVFELANEAVQALPKPDGVSLNRQIILAALHSAPDRPVKAGEIVWLAAETDSPVRLAAKLPDREVPLVGVGQTLDCGAPPPDGFLDSARAIDARDDRDVFIGCYRVRDGEDHKDWIIAFEGFDERGSPARYEAYASPLTIDTTAPPPPGQFLGRFVDGRAALNWQQPNAADLAGYEIERSATPLSGFEPVATTEFDRFRDDLELADAAYYRVRAYDRAGNRSAPTDVVPVYPVEGGPTPVTADIRTPTLWFSAASPYIVDDDLVIEQGARLTVEPGTRIEVAPDAAVIVQGRLIARGTDEAPIQWRLKPEAETRWAGLRFEAGASGELVYNNISDADIGLDIADADPLVEFNQFANNRVGAVVRDFALPNFLGNRLSRNGTGLVIQGAEPVVRGNMIRFNEAVGVEVSDAAPVLTGNDLSANGEAALRVRQSARTALVAANENYFGGTDPDQVWPQIEGPASIRWVRTDGAVMPGQTKAYASPKEGESLGLLVPLPPRGARLVQAKAQASTAQSSAPAVPQKALAPSDAALARQGIFDGNQAFNQGDFTTALARWEPVLEQADRNPSLQHSVAIARQATGDLEGALQAAQRAVDLNPASVPYLRTLGQLRSEAGDRDGAAEVFRQALQVDPDNITLQTLLKFNE